MNARMLNNNNSMAQLQGQHGHHGSGSISKPTLDFSNLPNINLSAIAMQKDNNNQTNNGQHKTTSSPLKRPFSSMDNDKHFDQMSLHKERRLNHDVHNAANKLFT